MKKVRVLLVVNYLNMGGTENFVFNVIRNIDKSRFDVEVLCCDRTEGSLEKEVAAFGIKIFKVTSRGQNLLKHLRELKNFFNENIFDAVHINYSNAFCITAARAAKKSGVKNIIIHSHNSQSYNKALHNILKKFLPLYANNYFACSKLAADWMFTKKINDANKVVIIKNAIDVCSYVYSEDYRNSIRQEFGVENRTVIGHVGRFNLQKNHEFLIDIFNEYIKIDKSAILLLIGEGELESGIKKYCNELGILQHVIFAGVRSDVNKMLSAMDCFVLPSFFEGLPVTLVEAQASGLYCLVSDVVTKEVKVTDIIEYFPLDKSASEWAKKINVSHKDRKIYNDTVKNSGFDIIQEVKRLESIYSK